MRFRAEQHLRRQFDFDHVRTHGRRHDCGAFMLWYARRAEPQAPIDSSAQPEAPTVQPVARLGVVASRSAVGNAVQRARAKRRLREVFRAHQQNVPAGYDLLLVARSAINRIEYRELERKFTEACRRIFSSHTS